MFHLNIKLCDIIPPLNLVDRAAVDHHVVPTSSPILPILSFLWFLDDIVHLTLRSLETTRRATLASTVPGKQRTPLRNNAWSAKSSPG